MDDIVYEPIIIIKNGKEIPIKTKQDYYAHRDVIVDGLRDQVLNMYTDIKSKYILSETEEFNLKNDSELVPEISFNTNINPDLILKKSSNNGFPEISINTSIWPKYNGFKTEMYRMATLANEFGDLDNFLNIMSMPEYANLLIFAATDSFLTDYIIQAERKVLFDRIKTMDDEQRKLHVEVADLLDQLRMQSRLPRKQQTGIDLAKFIELHKHGLEGTVYPCW